MLGVQCEVCAVIGLISLGGSYMAETIRSEPKSVEKTQLESAANPGMVKRLTMKEDVQNADIDKICRKDVC